MNFLFRLYFAISAPPPKFIKTLEDMNKCRRDQVIFHCTVSDADAPVNWFKNGSQIEIDDEQYDVISQGKS